MVKATEEMGEEEEKGQTQEIMSEERGRERNMKCMSSTHRDGTADKCTTFVCLLHFLQKKKQKKTSPCAVVPSQRLLLIHHLQYKINTGCTNFHRRNWLHKFSQKKLAARIFTEETGCTNFHRRNQLHKFSQKKLAARIFTEATGCTNFHRRNWLDECRTASDEHIKTLERGWFHIISTQVTSVH